jgi:predicted nuclease of predicted toxin-antitoxin system
MNIIVDMNLSPRRAVRLTDLGHSAAHWSTVGDPRAADVAILAWARARSHVLLSHDLDFPALLATTGQQGPSVVLLRRIRPEPGVLVAAVAQAITGHEPELVRGAILTIDPVGSRVRLLPLR